MAPLRRSVRTRSAPTVGRVRAAGGWVALGCLVLVAGCEPQAWWGDLAGAELWRGLLLAVVPPAILACARQLRPATRATSDWDRLETMKRTGTLLDAELDSNRAALLSGRWSSLPETVRDLPEPTSIVVVHEARKAYLARRRATPDTIPERLDRLVLQRLELLRSRAALDDERERVVQRLVNREAVHVTVRDARVGRFAVAVGFLLAYVVPLAARLAAPDGDLSANAATAIGLVLLVALVLACGGSSAVLQGWLFVRVRAVARRRCWSRLVEDVVNLVLVAVVGPAVGLVLAAAAFGLSLWILFGGS